MFNSKIQGWINYYTHYYKSAIYDTLKYINRCLIKWVRSKYKKKNSRRKAVNWLAGIAKREQSYFHSGNLEYYQRHDNWELYELRGSRTVLREA